MEQTGQYFVALSPTRQFDTALLEKMAEVLGTDAYNARLLLAAEMPLIIARFSDRVSADARVRELSALGLTAIAGADSDLSRASPEAFLARSLQVREKDAVFVNSSREILKLDSKDAFLILEGVLPAPEQKENKGGKTLNLPVTLLLGGIPVWRKTQQIISPAGENEHFLRFYNRTSPEPVMEIKSNEFDYSFLGDKKGFSSTQNFNRLSGELQRIFPCAIYDGRLTRGKGSAASPSNPETLERNIRLIYLFHIASISEPGSSKA